LIIVMTMAVSCVSSSCHCPAVRSNFHDLLGDKPLPPVTRFVLGVSGFMKTGLVCWSRCGHCGHLQLHRSPRGGRLALMFKLRMPLSAT
jgi:hypothetical protein